MTDHPRLEVPFDVVTKWEEIEGSCARFYAAAEWGYKQALATRPPEPPTNKERLALQEKLWDEYKIIPYQGGEFMSDDGFRHALSDYRAALERWGHR